MELTQLLRERRTVHTFADRPVSLDLVEQMLETAVWVPNHKMTQPWRFIVVQGEGRQRLANIARKVGERKGGEDPAKREEMAQRFYDRFSNVPMYVEVVIEESEKETTREEDYASASCIIHNFSLLAWEQGLGLVWETYPLLNNPEFREALGVRPNEKIVGSLHLGYPALVPEAKPRIPAGERLTVIDQA